MDELPPGVTAKRLQLLKRAAPNVSRVALLSATPGQGGHEAQLADAEKTARSLALTVKRYRATSPSELETALVAIVEFRMDGLVSFQGGLSLGSRQSSLTSRRRTICLRSTNRRSSWKLEG